MHLHKVCSKVYYLGFTVIKMSVIVQLSSYVFVPLKKKPFRALTYIKEL